MYRRKSNSFHHFDVRCLSFILLISKPRNKAFKKNIQLIPQLTDKNQRNWKKEKILEYRFVQIDPPPPFFFLK